VAWVDASAVPRNWQPPAVDRHHRRRDDGRNGGGDNDNEVLGGGERLRRTGHWHFEGAWADRFDMVWAVVRAALASGKCECGDGGSERDIAHRIWKHPQRLVKAIWKKRKEKQEL